MARVTFSLRPPENLYSHNYQDPKQLHRLALPNPNLAKFGACQKNGDLWQG